MLSRAVVPSIMNVLAVYMELKLLSSAQVPNITLLVRCMQASCKIASEEYIGSLMCDLEKK